MALHAVPEPERGDAGPDSSAPYDLETDPEALLLCALMWSYHPGADAPDAVRITQVLTAEDFEDYSHGRLFSVIADLVDEGQPFDVPSVAAALVRSGAAGQKDGPLRQRLVNIGTLGAFPLAAPHHADIVLSQSYRRSFLAVGRAIVSAAEELPEADLFEHLLDHGRRQRAAFNRLNDFRAPNRDDRLADRSTISEGNQPS
ncbi:DnaB-like helicase N-terminal domain-containing protein [Rhodococcus sp. IEGM 1374]|uniref:DnaB-like helicase N-terminal domain-containing protein n=1 Tax=Rhodococcus sp. IEGM 1374 TaxID=3082221 RepID=UPI0029557EEF|nr:DnaB-like helicase N-terminal domain-containing protein [Rhodococcus sp. IEGM 1374]MDV7991601.1 DnaB-like helicase N-terminal domain-containing protein [Rhodococcus sp. IEGM 1374]